MNKKCIMATVPKFCISNKTDCKTKCVTDKTGEYSASNTEGYGSPNPELDTYTAATLLFEKRNADGTFESLATTDLFPNLPNITQVPFCFGGEAFGQAADTVIPDGIYRATYSLTNTDPDLSISANQTFAITCSTECCFKKLADKAAFETCPSDLSEKFQEMSILMRGLEAAKNCGDLIVLNSLIEYLQKLCTHCNCSCND